MTHMLTVRLIYERSQANNTGHASHGSASGRFRIRWIEKMTFFASHKLSTLKPASTASLSLAHALTPATSKPPLSRPSTDSI